MTPDETRTAVARLDTTSWSDAEEAWNALRPLGVAVTPYLREEYPKFRKWQGRVSLLFHSIRFGRVSEDAFQLGLAALEDRSTLVRYRACGVVAYSLREEALEPLERLLSHSDARTVEDARAAIDAIRSRNHHYFIDRRHTGHSFWRVNDEDRV